MFLVTYMHRLLIPLRLARLIVLSVVLIHSSMPLAFASEDLEAKRFFEFTELKNLYDFADLAGPVEAKLNRLLTVPFVDNSISTENPAFNRSPVLGEFFRVAHWNIERGLEFEAIAAALESDDKLQPFLDTKRFPVGSEERKNIVEQAKALRAADVIVLNEVDWGIKRSEYQNIAEELARRLGMNYAFGVEFIELSPVHLSRTLLPAGTRTSGLSEILSLDEGQYKGLHGSAILSRFPLSNVRLVPFKHQPYDWFEAEKKGVTFVEKARRKLVKTIFLEDAAREVRRGGRTMLLADIVDPKVPAGKVTIIATHLENRTSPRHRQIQLREMLSFISSIENPVVITGDMNTSTNDMTPTSVQRELKKKFGKIESLAKTGVNYLLGFGLIEDAISASLTFGRTHGDPTVRHIPILMPNDERKFFSILKEFRFADGGAFDFRGESSRSAGGRRNTLANSNERDKKGFVTTFRLERPVKFIGRYKLDWIFVKPAALKDPSDYQGSYAFAPHFGRTLGAVNSVVDGRISDHSPMIVDLPLGEPAIKRGIAKARAK